MGRNIKHRVCRLAAAVKTGSNAVDAVRQTRALFAEATDVALTLRFLPLVWQVSTTTFTQSLIVEYY